MPDFCFEPLPGQDSLTEIYSKEICRNAAFKLDRPFPFTSRTLFRLRNGQWFFVRNNQEYTLEGRWTVVKS